MLGQSLSGYFAVLASVAALKFWFAYRVGVLWVDSRFAIALAAACAFPGVASYQLLSVGHPQFLEATAWGGALLATRVSKQGCVVHHARANFVLIGAVAALALHAHPTAIALLPGLAVWWWRSTGAAGPTRFASACLATAGFILIFLPRLVSAALGGADQAATTHVSGTPDFWGDVGAVWPLFRNIFFEDALRNAVVLLSPYPVALRIWQGIFVAVLLVTAIGAWLALWERPLRRLLVPAVLALLWCVALVALLRKHTPFYMLFVALPPLSVLLACCWCAWARLRHGVWLTNATILAVLLLHGANVCAIVALADAGYGPSRMPEHFKMAAGNAVAQAESVLAVTARDALARKWWCTMSPMPSLHGDLAAAMDVALGHEVSLRCPDRLLPRFGGRDQPWIGLPQRAWQTMGIAPSMLANGWGLTPAGEVFGPPEAMPRAEPRAYPPRMEAMLSALRMPAWEQRFDAASEFIVVSSMLPATPAFAVEAHLDGRKLAALLSFSNTSIFRRSPGGAGATTARWTLRVAGVPPEYTSIAGVSAPADTK